MGIDTGQAEQIQTTSERMPDRLSVADVGPLPGERNPSLKADGHQITIPSPFSLAEQDRLQGSAVLRSPEQLHLHPALVRLQLIDSAIAFNHAIRVKGRSLREPILVTTNGTIISGFRDWHEAVTDTRPSVDCIEYSLSDEEAIEFMLIRNQPQRTWNNFKRTRLALELEPYFQLKALANQIAGGKYKGSAILPKAEHIDVREEIAAVAGVGGRTVSNVKTILEKAAPKLLEALHNGVLTINRALQWCALPPSEQAEQFTHYSVERATGKVIRQSVARCSMQGTRHDSGAILDALRRQELREPGSVVMRAGRHRQTVILIGQDLWSAPHLNMELPKA